MLDVEYKKATDLVDAIDFLNTNGVETKILAGGTDFYPNLGDTTASFISIP